MRHYLTGLLCLMMISILVGCGEAALSENYSEEKLKTAAINVVQLFNNEAYDKILNSGTKKLKLQISSFQLESAWKPVYEKTGSFVEISSNPKYYEKDDYATVVIIAKYEKCKIQFTISFDKDMKLAGVYFK